MLEPAYLAKYKGKDIFITFLVNRIENARQLAYTFLTK
ncbi:DUF6864 domain-containing function [Acinetobacter baumannii]